MRRQSTSLLASSLLGNLLPEGPATPPVKPPAQPEPPTSYVELYGLSRRPFGGKAERAAYILFNSHRRAFELLVDHLLNGHGAVLLTGDDGMGKTEMLRAAADMAEGNGRRVVRFVRPSDGRLDHGEFAAALTGDPTASQDDIVRAVQASGRTAILVDDFDLLPPESLAALRSSMQPREGGPPPILPPLILAGASGLRRPEVAPLLTQLRNTIRLIPLSPAECHHFIERSLWIAGGTSRRLIERDAIRAVIAESGGSPGRIARLMDAAMTTGFARADAMITTRTVTAAIGPAARHRRWRTRAGESVVGRAAAIVSLGLFAVGAGLFAYEAWHGPAQPPKPSVAISPSLPEAGQVAPARSAATLSPDLVAALLKRGNDSLALGDIAAARLLLQKAAAAGSAAAALSLGKTYDVNEAAPPPADADAKRAAEWYRKAQALGDPGATDLLRRLGAPR